MEDCECQDGEDNHTKSNKSAIEIKKWERGDTYTPSNTIKSDSLCITLFLHPPLSSGMRYTHLINSVTNDSSNAPRKILNFRDARNSAVAGFRLCELPRTRRKYSAEKNAKIRSETT